MNGQSHPEHSSADDARTSKSPASVPRATDDTPSTLPPSIAAELQRKLKRGDFLTRDAAELSAERLLDTDDI